MWWLKRATCCIAHSQMMVFSPQLIFWFIYPMLNLWCYSVFNDGKSNLSCLTVYLHWKKKKKSLKWRWSVSDRWLSTHAKRARLRKEKGLYISCYCLCRFLSLPSVTGVSSSTLAASYFCWPKGQPPPEDALQCARGMAQNSGPQNGGTGSSVFSMWRNRQKKCKQTHGLSKNLIKFIVFQQETRQELTLLGFE